MTPHDDFLVAMFNDDPQLLEAFRQADANRRWNRWKECAYIAGAWIGMLTICTVIWIGVIRAIGAW